MPIGPFHHISRERAIIPALRRLSTGSRFPACWLLPVLVAFALHLPHSQRTIGSSPLNKSKTLNSASAARSSYGSSTSVSSPALSSRSCISGTTTAARKTVRLIRFGKCQTRYIESVFPSVWNALSQAFEGAVLGCV